MGAEGVMRMLLGAAGRITSDWNQITTSQLEEVAKEGFSAHALRVNDPSDVRDSDVRRIKKTFQTRIVPKNT